MKLIKIKNSENDEAWYFSSLRKCARYIGAADSNLRMAINKKRKCGGWDVEEIESDEILSKYIDPERL